MSASRLVCCATALLAMAAVSACAGRVRTPPRSAPNLAVPTGDNVSAATTGTTPAPSLAPGQLLILFKRAVGVDPLSSQLTVDRDGRTAALITIGGVGGQHKQVFALPTAALHHLRALLRSARLRDTRCCDPRYYIYEISAEGHSWRLQEGDVPRSLQPLIGYLDTILDRHTAYNAPS